MNKVNTIDIFMTRNCNIINNHRWAAIKQAFGLKARLRNKDNHLLILNYKHVPAVVVVVVAIISFSKIKFQKMIY